MDDKAEGGQQSAAAVVVPTYEERGTITLLLQRLLELEGPYQVIVVDDSSPDGTAEAARRVANDSEGRVSVMLRGAKLGLASAYLRGFSWALTRGYPAVCQMDGDLSHDPADLPRLVSALKEADLAIGSRYAPGGGVKGWSRSRLNLSRAANRYSRRVLRLPLADVTSGFRAWRASALIKLGLENIHSEGYAFQIETAYRAHLASLRLAEVPICFSGRTEGRSKMNLPVLTEASLRVSQWGLARDFEMVRKKGRGNQGRAQIKLP